MSPDKTSEAIDLTDSPLKKKKEKEMETVANVGRKKERDDEFRISILIFFLDETSQ